MILQTIEFLDDSVGNFKYGLKCNEEYSSLMKGDSKAVKFKPYMTDKLSNLEAWVYCDSVKESYTWSIKLPLVCLGLWRKEIPTVGKGSYFYWTQPQKNVLCDDIIQKLTFYCTDISGCVISSRTQYLRRKNT